MFNLFKKKKSEPTRGDQYLSLKIREIVKETPDTVSIYFEQPEPYLDYKPGQFITVILDINGKEERRSYSLCTSPFVDPFPGISVKRVSGGIVSNYLNDQLRPGKTMEIMKPMGNFTTDFHSKNSIQYFMIAGGSGITPIMGLIKSILINEPSSKVTLLFCSRNEEQIIFKKNIDLLVSQHPEKLEVIHNLSQPSTDWTGMKGRLDSTKVKEVLSGSEDASKTEKRYFVCGPEGLMSTTLNTLKELNIPESIIHEESFYSDLDAKEAAMKASGEIGPSLTREITVNVEGQDYTYEVAPDKTILEAGLDNNIDMPYSCQSGLCTACRGRLVSGKVDMIEDAGLSAGEIAEGYILCCSSKAASSDIKIIIE
ncbi:2Fe-2S iron-sulfur cluster-binding protein [Belliella kenyensis]|uniref:2Fe-2S iron-sulfur cluster-binding protein n=1 Tax=Belliella kenyensis TaxID=1472724 RepID=A0ABV8EM14_9BACT|nr:ferredoxin--NADP reductase [Belliella kenyensis]MCH7403605.1 ferredoxin--NADP reductase [Belliella kenyensis]MDN3603843.1 ferredoxin--NADP reductase [Belliella kenyensis]